MQKWQEPVLAAEKLRVVEQLQQVVVVWALEFELAEKAPMA
jgi:hypothetical protein